MATVAAISLGYGAVQADTGVRLAHAEQSIKKIEESVDDRLDKIQNNIGANTRRLDDIYYYLLNQTAKPEQ